MKTIGIITAVPWESQPFVELYKLTRLAKNNRNYFVSEYRGTRLVVTNCNAGPVNAAAATEALIDQFSPTYIISSGSAGSHSLDVLPGSVVVGQSYSINYNVIDEDRGVIRRKKSSMIRFFDVGNNQISIESIAADKTLLQRLREISARTKAILNFVHIGSEDAWTVDRSTIEAKVNRFGHQVEDKESAYIAQICHQHHVPFVSVRGISDNELLATPYTSEEMDITMAKAAAGAATTVALLVEALIGQS